MAFDKTQPYATVNTDAGNIYYLQSGVFYNSFDLSVAISPPAPIDYVDLSKGLSTNLDVYKNVLGSGNPLSVPSALFSGAKLRRKTLGNLRNGLLNQVAVNSGAFSSYLHELTIAAPCSAVRFHVPNSHPTAVPQIRIAFGYSEISGDPSAALNTLTVGGVASSTAGAWLNATRNGATAWGLPCMFGSTVNKPFYTASDWMQSMSLARSEAGRDKPILKVIHEWGGFESLVATASTMTLQAASTGITGWEDDTQVAAPPFGRIHRTRVQAVAAGVDPTTLTSTTADNSSVNYHSPIITEYALANGYGLQFIILGDSEAEGTGDTIDKFGHLHRAILPLSSTKLPIDVINAAQAGTNTANWVTMAENIVPLFPGSIVVVPNMSPNSTMPLGNLVTGATIVNAGTGGTPGAVTLTGTTGTGTPFQATGTIGSDGTLQSITAITVQGNYSVLPAVIQAEPVTGGGLTGCTLNLEIAGSTMTLVKRDISRIKTICDQYNCAMVMLTCLPSNTAGKDYKGGDPIRQQWNSDTIASGEMVIDAASIINGVTTGNQIQMLAGTTTDSLHMNATGHALVASSVTTPFFKLITG